MSQWTKEEALKMSREKYREKYLGISTFGITPEPVQIEPVETEIDIEIEQMVQDDLPNKKPTVGIDRISDDPKINILYTAFERKQFVSIIYDDKATLIQPQEFISGGIKAYCYVKNSVRNFDFDRIQNAVFKETPFILEVTGPEIGIDQISRLIGLAIQHRKYIRMRYVRREWTNWQRDEETDELVGVRVESEESLRTISNVQLAVNALDEEIIRIYNLDDNYIAAYCNLRDDERVFNFNRIIEIAILNI